MNLRETAMTIPMQATLARVKNWISDPYRPELHYMRGPGPKWREKHARAGSIRSKSPDIGSGAAVGLAPAGAIRRAA